MKFLTGLLNRFFSNKQQPPKYDICEELLSVLATNPTAWRRKAYSTWSHISNTLPEAISAARYLEANIDKPVIIELPRPVSTTLLDFMTDSQGTLCNDRLLFDYVLAVQKVLTLIPDTASPAKEIEYNYIRGMLKHEMHCLLISLIYT